MTIDPLEPYRLYIDNFDLTEEEKLELVNTLVLITEMLLEKKFRFLNHKKKTDD